MAMKVGIVFVVLMVFHLIGAKKDDVIEVNFYLHDVATGAGATVVQSGGSNLTPLQFGQIFTIDDLVTSGPSNTSSALGRAQGTYTSAAFDGLSLFLDFTVTLQNGSFNIQGLDRIIDNQRSVAITGGTGIYKFSIGVVNITTFSAVGPNFILLYQARMIKLL